MIDAHPELVPVAAVPQSSWDRLRSWSASGAFDPALCDERDDEDTAAMPAVDGADPARVAALHQYDRAKGGNTAILVQRLTRMGLLQASDDPGAPHGFFRGWLVIGSDTPINGGVYLGRKPREAIVVDMRRPGSMLLATYEAWRTALTGARSKADVRADLEQTLPARIAALVAEHMPYDEAAVHRLERRGLLRPDEPIDLDVFLLERGGVCRHQVCLVGAFLERLALEGWMEGKACLERKFVSGWFSHAWVRFTAKDGQTWVLDPAQRRYERLEALDPSAQLLYGELMRA